MIKEFLEKIVERFLGYSTPEDEAGYSIRSGVLDRLSKDQWTKVTPSPQKSPEKIERTLRIVWGEVAPTTYADLPTYADMPTYGDMLRAFGDKSNWPKRNTETVLQSPERLEALRAGSPRLTVGQAWRQSIDGSPPREIRPFPKRDKGRDRDWTRYEPI